MLSTTGESKLWGRALFSFDHSVSHLLELPLSNEVDCENVAKAAIEYALETLGVPANGQPTAWQSSYLYVIEDAIIHHIDRALATRTTVGEFEQELKQFIDRLGEIFRTAQPRSETVLEADLH